MADTSLSVGNLSTSAGATRLFGTNSKIDTETLVKAAYETKRLPAVRLERKIEQNDAKAAAYGELRGLLQDLKTAVAGLRNPPGALGARENLFEAKEAYLSSSTTTAPNTLVGIDIEPGAASGSFGLVVDRLATAEKRSSASVGGGNVSLADAWNGGTAFAGELRLGLAGGTEKTVAVDGTMTLAKLKDAVNAVAGETGVRASVLKLSDGDHRLVLSGAETGKAITLANGADDDVVARLGLTVVQPARTSRVLVDGVPVERSGNTIDDLADGMTISLFRADPGTTVSVGVEPSLAPIKDGIKGFVEAYNALRAFVEKNTALDDAGKPKDGAVLAGDRVLRTLADGMAGLIGESVPGAPAGGLSTLRDLGITLDENNRLVLDDAALDRKLLADLDGVRGVLEFGFTASSPDVRVLSRTNALRDTSFSLSITDANNDGVPESAAFDGVAAEIVDGRVKGKKGTAYEGLELGWVGRGSASIAIETRPGMADRLFNALDDALYPDQGPMDRAIKDLGGLSDTYRSQIETIDQRAEAVREWLIARYTAMETALSVANTMMAQVRAQMDAMSGGN
jgi:flagellar hook-associated protein 2